MLLSQQFKLKDLGCVNHFLRLEIARSTDDIFLSQRQYTLDLLQDTCFFEESKKFQGYVSQQPISKRENRKRRIWN